MVVKKTSTTASSKKPAVHKPTAKKIDAEGAKSVVKSAEPADIIDAEVISEIPKKTVEAAPKPIPKQAEREKVKPDPTPPAKTKSPLLPMLASAAVAGALAASAISFVWPDISGQRGEIGRVQAENQARLQLLEAQTPSPVAPDNSAELEGLNAQLNALQVAFDNSQEVVKTQQQQLAKLQQALDDLSVNAVQPSEGNTGSAQQLTQVMAELAQLKQRLDVQSEQGAALGNQLAGLTNERAQLSEAKAEVTEVAAAAKQSATSSELRLLAIQLQANFDQGQPYAKTLAEIETLTEITIPAVLLGTATTGIKTLNQLQQTYAPAARAGLKAAIKAEASEGIMAKLGAFFKAQVGARSLEERAGDDPDAILSQAEAALRRGEVQNAVALVRRLPQPAQQAMRDWLSGANAQLQAQAGLNRLITSLEIEN